MNRNLTDLAEHLAEHVFYLHELLIRKKKYLKSTGRKRLLKSKHLQSFQEEKKNTNKRNDKL